jgi:hypothetical protein
VGQFESRGRIRHYDSVVGRIGWALWDVAGIASIAFIGVPILGFWFPIYVVVTIAILYWRYRNGRYRVVFSDRSHGDVDSK